MVSSDPVGREKICPLRYVSKSCMVRQCSGPPYSTSTMLGFGEGLDHLRFFSGNVNKAERILPCKVSCSLCGALIADEGRNMWLGFPTLFDFGTPPNIPEAFKPKCPHISMQLGCFDMDNDLPKCAGHSEKSARLVRYVSRRHYGALTLGGDAEAFGRPPTPRQLPKQRRPRSRTLRTPFC